ENVPTILFGAEIGFHPPQGEENPALHLEFLFDRIKSLGPFAGLELSIRDAAVRDDRVHIVADPVSVFPLAFGGCNYAWGGPYAFQGKIESSAGNSFGLGVRPKLRRKRRK